MNKTDLDSLLLAESRKIMDVSGCKNADALLEAVAETDENLLAEDDLDFVAAAGSDQAFVLQKLRGKILKRI